MLQATFTKRNASDYILGEMLLTTFSNFNEMLQSSDFVECRLVSY
jgi:hypothetical protein